MTRSTDYNSTPMFNTPQANPTSTPGISPFTDVVAICGVSRVVPARCISPLPSIHAFPSPPSPCCTRSQAVHQSHLQFIATEREADQSIKARARSYAQTWEEVQRASATQLGRRLTPDARLQTRRPRDAWIELCRLQRRAAEICRQKEVSKEFQDCKH